MGTESKEYIQALKVVDGGGDGSSPWSTLVQRLASEFSMLLRDGDWVTFPQSMRAALGTCVRRVWASCKWFPLGVTSSGKSGEEKPGLFCLFPFFICCFCFGPLSQHILRHGP